MSTKKASAKSKAEPVNPFLEPEERNAKAGAATVDAQVPKALAGKVHPIDPQDLVIRVRVNDKAPWEGELALNLVGESNHALLVKNTDTEQLVSVDVKKLQIVGVLA